MSERLEAELEKLRDDPQFQVLLHNLYGQAKSCATSPFEKDNGFKNFKEIAELDMLMYLKQSRQVQWESPHVSVQA